MANDIDDKKKKRKISVEVDDKTFLALKKILFANGIKVGEFFNCIVEKACTNDDVILKLIHDTIKNREEKINAGHITKGIDARTLYQLIEAQNNKKMHE